MSDPTASSPAPTRIYLAPGLFGFARLAGFDYLQHVRKALADRFQERGRAVEIRVVDVHPCASIHRRATRLIHLIAKTAGKAGPIHLLGLPPAGSTCASWPHPAVSWARPRRRSPTGSTAWRR